MDEPVALHNVAEAVKRKVFARALKDLNLKLPDDLADLIARLLLKRDAMSCLSLASKAGQVSCRV